LVAAIRHFFLELRRRKVIGVAAAYIILGWPLMEVAAFLEETFQLPDWFDRLVTLLVVFGFGFTVVLAWVFNITSRGIEVTNGASDTVPEGDSPSPPIPVVPEPPVVDSSIASVCVLPFDNLSQNQDDDTLAVGLATEIHSTLRRMHRLRVASQRSAFRYRDIDASVQDIAAALNVRYVLSGSLVHWGNRIRVIAELDDAETSSQIWSEKYEREMDDILRIQAEISEAIVATFGIERQRDELENAFRRPTENLDAWSMVQRARHYILDYSERSFDEAYKLLRKSLEVDPDYAAALAVTGSVLCERVLNGFSDDIEAERKEACELVRRAADLAPNDPFVLKNVGTVAAYCGDAEASLRALQRCVDLAPYDFGAWGYFGWPLVARGKPEDLQRLHETMDHLFEVAPDHPGIGYWLYHKSVASLCEGELGPAEDSIRHALDKHPKVSWGWMHLASVLGAQGKSEQARNAAAEARRINPAMTPEHFADCLAAMSGPDSPTEARVEGLKKAGLLDE
jgi:adenylate cyclase